MTESKKPLKRLGNNRMQLYIFIKKSVIFILKVEIKIIVNYEIQVWQFLS